MNTRTVIALLIALSLVLGCAMAVLSLPDRRRKPAMQAQTAAVPQASAAPAGVALPPPGTDAQTQADMQSMLPLLSACVNALDAQGAQALDAADTALVWRTLCLLYPQGETVSGETLLSLYRACFGEADALPALPSTAKKAGLAYDKKQNAYTLPPTASDGYCALGDVRVCPGLSNAYTVTLAHLCGTGANLQLLNTYAFTLQRTAEGAYPFRLLSGQAQCNLTGFILRAENAAEGLQLTVRPATLDVPHHHVNPTGEPDQTLRLINAQAVDAGMLALLLGVQTPPAEAEPLLSWFAQSCTQSALGMPIAYQMKVYDGVVYSLAPLYAYYFAPVPSDGTAGG